MSKIIFKAIQNWGWGGRGGEEGGFWQLFSIILVPHKF